MKKIVINQTVKLVDENDEDLLDLRQDVFEATNYSVQEIIIPPDTEDVEIAKPAYPTYKSLEFLSIESDNEITVVISKMGQTSNYGSLTKLNIAAKEGGISGYGSIKVYNYSATLPAKIKVIMGLMDNI